jgi:hypothetical protein
MVTERATAMSNDAQGHEATTPRAARAPLHALHRDCPSITSRAERAEGR